MLNETLNEVSIDLNTEDDEWKTILHYAVSTGQLECVKVLLAVKGIDVNTKDSLSDTSIVSVFESGSPDTQQIHTLLIEHGAEPYDDENMWNLWNEF